LFGLGGNDLGVVSFCSSKRTLCFDFVPDDVNDDKEDVDGTEETTVVNEAVESDAVTSEIDCSSFGG